MTLHSAQWALWDAVNLRDGCCAKSSSPAEWKIAEHFASVLNVRGDLVWTRQLHWHTLLGPQNKCFKFQTGAGGHWEYFAQLSDTDTSLLSKQCTTQCMLWDATGSRRVFWHRFNLSMVFTSFCQCPLSRFSWAPPHPSCPSYRAPWGHKTSHLHSPHLHFTAKVHSSFTSLCAAALLTFFHSRLTHIIILMVRDSLTSSSFSALKVHQHKSLDSRFIDTKLKII